MQVSSVDCVIGLFISIHPFFDFQSGSMVSYPCPVLCFSKYHAYLWEWQFTKYSKLKDLLVGLIKLVQYKMNLKSCIFISRLFTILSGCSSCSSSSSVNFVLFRHSSIARFLAMLQSQVCSLDLPAYVFFAVMAL